jgi:DNA-binding CsgD family transcriptional regulator
MIRWHALSEARRLDRLSYRAAPLSTTSVDVAERDGGAIGGYGGQPITGWGLLTTKERQVAELTVRGLKTAVIGLTLGMAESTVKTHLKHIFAKVGVSNRVQTQRVGSCSKRSLMPTSISSGRPLHRRSSPVLRPPTLPSTAPREVCSVDRIYSYMRQNT